MKRSISFFILLISIGLSCSPSNEEQPIKKVNPYSAKLNETPTFIPLDREVLSGLNLKSVKDHRQPNRRLFQKKLIGGDELSVYIVSSETASAQQNNYGIDEFIYLLNGRSRLNPTNGTEVIFSKGDYFVTPRGFTGEWETLGGNEFLIELSIVSSTRAKNNAKNTLPVQIPTSLISGFGIKNTESINAIGRYKNIAYSGSELNVFILGESPQNRRINTDKEQVIQVLSGMVTIIGKEGGEYQFYSGDWLMIPKGVEATWRTEAHGLFRWLSIKQAQL